MRTTIVIAVAIMLSGCVSAPDHYGRSGTNRAQFDQDFAGCRLVAMGMPERHTQVNSYTAQTNYYGSQSTTTVGPDPYAAAGAAIGDLIGNNQRQAKALRLCMQSRGYSLRQ